MDLGLIVIIVMVIVLCIFILVSFLIYWKFGISKTISFLFALATAYLLLNLSIKTLFECSQSIAIKGSLKTSLSPRDFSNMKPNRFICPTEYSYTRSGKKEWASFFDDRVIFQSEIERASGG